MNNPCQIHTAKIEQVFQRIDELRDDLKAMRKEEKEEREKLWDALEALRESITGNGKDGLTVQVDRNTNFRKNMNKLLWFLFTPLYGGIVVILLKIIFEK